MKIVIDDAIPFLEGRLPENVDKVIMPGLDIKAVDVADADALLVRTRTRCDAALLEGSKVRLVATATIGADHFNLPELERLGIEAVNSPGCNAPAVAQYVWSCLLRLGFKPGRDVLGLVGKGHVGGIVADWGRALGADVLVCDPPRKDAGLTDEDYLSLQEVMEKSDAVTFHVPKTLSGPYPTIGLCSKKRIDLLKPGAIIINASRGGIVDEEALVESIRNAHTRAVIDTWDGEPHIRNRELLREAVIATPHIAGYSLEGKERATRMVLEAVGKSLGIEVDTSGLEGPYSPLKRLTSEGIAASYDPFVDMKMLRENPDSFEALRDGYPLRKEYRP